MPAFADSIGKRVSDLRTKKGLSQQEVGDLITRSGGHISNIENGKAELTPSELDKLATEFEVNSLFLFAGITNDVSEIVDMVARMEPAKRKLALKLFRLNLEMMEITKNWPSDAVNA